MHLKRVQISNFRNLKALDVSLSDNIVMLGENRVGKSNFIFALRLVLDASLPDSARQLKLTDIWDGCDLDARPEVAVHLDFCKFDSDNNLITALTDFRLPDDHTTARVSYVFRRKAESVAGAPTDSDYEFLVYGGHHEDNRVGSDLRQRIRVEVLEALRDAEGDLGNWRRSPLRPLLEDAISGVPRPDLDAVANDVGLATERLCALPPIRALEDSIRDRVAGLAGDAHDIDPRLGFAPTDPLRLFKSIGVFIDGGRRGISEASLGSANLALMTLKLAEFEWRRTKGERDYTLICVEEPEAHLHPHLQRRIFQQLFSSQVEERRGLLLTTHSPHVASIAPLRSIVVLRSTPHDGTCAYSLADLSLSNDEFDDIQRYLDTNRAEILFSKGVIFVEGDAEAALVPVFAKTCGLDTDAAGVTICSVGGVNFRPYVKLAKSLSLPFVVITDWDPTNGVALGWKRALDMIADIRLISGDPPLEENAVETRDEAALRDTAAGYGIFLNRTTLELELAFSPAMLTALLDVLEEAKFGSVRQRRLADWRVAPETVNGEQLMSMIAAIGKGRFSSKVATRAATLEPPEYVRNALSAIAQHV